MDIKDKRIQELENQNKKLEERIKELERRLGLNSNNSSKPPSSDGLAKKPRTKSLRESNKEFGGQVGHSGNTLQKVEDPDETIIHDIKNCLSCGESLEDSPIVETIDRQEIDVVVKRKVTEHKTFTRKCKCGSKNKAEFPGHIKSPVQYGNTVRALAIYLSNQFIPKNRCSELFSDIFQIPISDTTLMSYDAECASNLYVFHDFVLDEIKKSEVVNFDESGFRVNNKTHWIHVSGTESITHYRISPKRGDVLDGFTGIAVHDHWKPYMSKMPDAEHTFCNAHYLRELRNLFENLEESWAKSMYDLLLYASKIDLSNNKEIEKIEQEYDEIVNEGLDYHQELEPYRKSGCKKRTGHNLLLRLQKYKTESLRFLNNDQVPFTNNLAERDIRMIKLKQKISGCFRTEKGANDFAITRSFISTLRKQRKNIFENLYMAINGEVNIQSFAPS